MADMTVTQLIKSSLRLIGAIATGETPSADEINDAFEALKIMLRQWSSRGHMIFVQTHGNHTLTGGTASYTIGSGATINAARPVQIVGAYVRVDNVDHQLKIVGPEEYRRIAQKGHGATNPSILHYEPGYSTGRIYLWPAGGGTLYYDALVPLTEPGSLTADVTMPGEYDAAIKWGLACELAPEYGIEPSIFLISKAEEAKNDIIRINAILAQGDFYPEIMELTYRYDIDEG